MTYSRFFYTEYESPFKNDNDEGRFAIFSTPQFLTPSLGFRKEVGLQRFAVLWDGIPDKQLIQIIEEAIAARVMSPVRVLHVSEGRLEIIADRNLSGDKKKAFEYAWRALAGKAMMGAWTAAVFTEGEMRPAVDGGRLLRSYAPEILKYGALGIQNYSLALCLVSGEWVAPKVT
jgi:hypothetical protein